MLEQVLAVVRDNWKDVCPDGPCPPDFEYLLQSRRRVILFLFDADRSSVKPVAVVKISRTQNENARLRQTVHNMQQIRKLLDPPISATIPNATYLGEINGHAVSLETPVIGISISPARLKIRRKSMVMQTMNAVADWLFLFHQSTTMDHQVITQEALSKVLSTMNEVQSYAELVSESWFEASAQTLLAGRLPVSWQSGDTHPSNFLITGERVTGVVDWEGTQVSAWPIFDWFHFILHYVMESAKKTSPSSGRAQTASLAINILCGNAATVMAKSLREATLSYLDRYQIQADALPVLWLLFLSQLWWPEDKKPLLALAVSLLRNSP